ncbi:hypothetical protein AB1N83_006166 [Pleurotus pulmonarius]
MPTNCTTFCSDMRPYALTPVSAATDVADPNLGAHRNPLFLCRFPSSRGEYSELQAPAAKMGVWALLRHLHTTMVSDNPSVQPAGTLFLARRHEGLARFHQRLTGNDFSGPIIKTFKLYLHGWRLIASAWRVVQAVWRTEIEAGQSTTTWRASFSYRRVPTTRSPRRTAGYVALFPLLPVACSLVEYATESKWYAADCLRRLSDPSWAPTNVERNAGSAARSKSATMS